MENAVLRADSIAIPRLAKISIGFAVTFWFYVVILVFLFSFSVSYVFLNKVVQIQEKLFLEQGERISRVILTSLGSYAVDRRAELARASLMFAELSKEQNGVKEIFVLDKVGRVLAHSDFTQISPKSRRVADEIHPRYNTEFYHSALKLSAGEWQAREVMESSNLAIGRYFLSWFLGHERKALVDFSRPLVEKGEKVASVHVLLARDEAFYIWLEDQVIFFLVFSLGLSFLLWFFLLAGFWLRNHVADRRYYKELAQSIENAWLKSQLAQMQDISHKLEELEKKELRELPAQKASKEPLDALYLGE
ncbi:MAG: hypothetical protein NZM25_05405 [Leptospiraceae bacterium]|nr:hypothetical protein [Leptospiraceae bacterium]MDW8305558.1 hypothetical protein [Leptospiraceae bacterium]